MDVQAATRHPTDETNVTSSARSSYEGTSGRKSEAPASRRSAGQDRRPSRNSPTKAHFKKRTIKLAIYLKLVTAISLNPTGAVVSLSNDI